MAKILSKKDWRRSKRDAKRANSNKDGFVDFGNSYYSGGYSCEDECMFCGRVGGHYAGCAGIVHRF